MTVGGVNLNLSDPPAATDSPSQNTERYYRPLKPNEIKKNIFDNELRRSLLQSYLNYFLFPQKRIISYSEICAFKALTFKTSFL